MLQPRTGPPCAASPIRSQRIHPGCPAPCRNRRSYPPGAIPTPASSAVLPRRTSRSCPSARGTRAPTTLSDDAGLHTDRQAGRRGCEEAPGRRTGASRPGGMTGGGKWRGRPPRGVVEPVWAQPFLLRRHHCHPSRMSQRHAPRRGAVSGLGPARPMRYHRTVDIDARSTVPREASGGNAPIARSDRE